MPKARMFYSASDEDDNHFVSITLRKKKGRIKLDYMDSNGVLISAKDKEMIKGVFYKNPVDIFYRNKKGERITETSAIVDPKQLLRTQFDQDSCGMYSAEYTRMMLHAQGNEVKIKQGIKEILRLDIARTRQAHAYQLGHNVELPKTIYRQLPAKVKFMNKPTTVSYRQQIGRVPSTTTSFREKIEEEYRNRNNIIAPAA